MRFPFVVPSLQLTRLSSRLPSPSPFQLHRFHSEPSWVKIVSADAQTGMLSAEASSAICVQKFDDSRNSAIHTTYRISLRSSSLREPRYPLLRVVSVSFAFPSPNHLRPEQLPAQFFSLKFYRVYCVKLVRNNRPLPKERPISLSYSSRVDVDDCVAMILPQVHLRKPCYDFSFL